jgi:hypothetical protein
VDVAIRGRGSLTRVLQVMFYLHILHLAMSEIKLQRHFIAVGTINFPSDDTDQTGRLDARANPCPPSLLPHLRLPVEQA